MWLILEFTNYKKMQNNERVVLYNRYRSLGRRGPCLVWRFHFLVIAVRRWWQCCRFSPRALLPPYLALLVGFQCLQCGGLYFVVRGRPLP